MEIFVEIFGGLLAFTIAAFFIVRIAGK